MSHKAIFKTIDFRALDSLNDLEPLPIKISDAVNPERVVRFCASDDTVDRMDEVILPEGWDLTDWVRNPVVMQFHDYSMWPLGKGTAAGIVDDALMLDVEFDPPEIDESADMIYRKVKHGTVKTGSVGFEPLQWVTPGSKGDNLDLWTKYPKARKIYLRQSLIEFTICPIPANPNAVAAAMAKMYGKNLGLESIENAASDSLAGINDAALKIMQLRMAGMTR
jgi:HK97 family phage prohead protease